MVKTRTITKLKAKLNRSPGNMKLRFKLIDILIKNNEITSALDCVRDGLHEVQEEKSRCLLLEKADELLSTNENDDEKKFFQDLYNDTVDIEKDKIYKNVLQYYMGKQYIEMVAKQKGLMDPREVTGTCMEAIQQIKNAQSVELPLQYRFLCQLALARASLYTGNRKGALEKLEKMETNFSFIKGMEKHWLMFYQLLTHLTFKHAGDLDRARIYALKSLKLGRASLFHGHVRLELGDILYSMERYGESLDTFEQAFSDFRSAKILPPFELFVKAARSARMLNRVDDALDILNRCGEVLEPTSQESYILHNTRAEYLREVSLWKQASKAQRQAYKLANTDKDKMESGLKYLKDLFMIKNFKQIVEEVPFLENLERHPRIVQEFNVLVGTAYYHVGNWQETIKYLSPLFPGNKAISTKHVNTAFILAKSFEQQGNFQESITIYSSIINIAPDRKEGMQSMKSLKHIRKLLEEKDLTQKKEEPSTPTRYNSSQDVENTAVVSTRETPEPSEMDTSDMVEQLTGIIEEKTSEFTLANRLKKGLWKTRQTFTVKMHSMISGAKIVDESLLEELEELMILSDFGTATTLEVLKNIRKEIDTGGIRSPADLQPRIKDYLKEYFMSYSLELSFAEETPTVFLVVGVNGVGKTTTIAKLAHRYKKQGKNVMLVAADTFRAGAIEQIGLWADKVGVELIKHSPGSDPSAVVYDAIYAARSRGIDLIIIDTAGRLQTKINLMEEMKKIQRIISRAIPEAPHEVLLVLDATTGQNAISQAKAFHEAVTISGMVLTKLDGTAKGGIIVNIAKDMGIPVKLIGIGEQMDDLQDFNPEDFITSLLE